MRFIPARSHHRRRGKIRSIKTSRGDASTLLRGLSWDVLKREVVKYTWKFCKIMMSFCLHLSPCLFVCLFVCLIACLFVCLLACLFACLLVCLFACLLVCLFACLLVCLFVCLFVCFHFVKDDPTRLKKSLPSTPPRT